MLWKLIGNWQQLTVIFWNWGDIGLTPASMEYSDEEATETLHLEDRPEQKQFYSEK